MGLSLTSTAALHLDIDARGTACVGRGLDGQELVLDAAAALEALATDASASQAHVVALRVLSLDRDCAPVIALLAARWQVPVSVPAHSQAVDDIATIGRIFAAAGARLHLGHGTSVSGMMAVLSAIQDAGVDQTVGLAWELRPSSEGLEDAGAVLFAAREHLGLVRLYGGGPEQHDQQGLGVGALLTDLALSHYTGPIVLNPSTPDQLPRWHRWLESRKPTGCGSGGDAKELLVDVRNVEPKDRLDTILGAYKALRRGATLKLTVDHDPSCMYFMLEATEPAGSFEFRTTETGPETWRAEVRKA